MKLVCQKHGLAFFSVASLLLAALPQLSPLPLGAADNIEDLRELKFNRTKIPVYNKPEADGGKRMLQIMVFLDSAGRRGRILNGRNVVLDVIQRGSDVDDIMDNWRKDPPYPLLAKLDQVAEFWSWQRNSFSDGVIFSPTCEIDIERRIASGGDKVYFRSPQLDMDGIGFKVDFSRRTVLVHRDVRIVARHANSDPRRFSAGRAPANAEYITATGDSLLIDLDRNQVMLIGSVEVKENRGRLECDRLTIFIDRKGDSGGEISTAVLPVSSNATGGISRILADGNVRAEEAPKIPGTPPNRLTADHLEYEMSTGILNVTGNEVQPKLTGASGESMSADRFRVLRNEERLYAYGNCKIELIEKSTSPDGSAAGRVVRTVTGNQGFFDLAADHGELVGNVKAEDPQMTLYCDRMELLLARNIKAATATATSKAASDSAIASESAVPGGKRELDRVKALGKVKVVSKQPSSPERGNSTLTAKTADFNYRGNVLVFEPDVRIVDKRSVLTTDRLEIYLADRPSTASPADAQVGKADFNPLFGGGASGGKRLERTVALGRVKMSDPGADMNTDKLTMYFEALPDGVTAAPGMFQSGGTRLVKAFCEGNFKAVTRMNPGGSAAEPDAGRDGFAALAGQSKGPRTLTSVNATVDLTANRSEFHDKVTVSDAENKLNCEDMYLFAESGSGTAANAVALADPDADPYILRSESALPSRLILTPGLELTRVLCERAVQLERRSPDGTKQRAGGDRGEYTVSSREVVITATPPSRPWLSASGMRQYCDRIVLDTETEIFRTEGATDTVRE